MVGSAFCSIDMARQYLQHGCLGYLTYVVDTRVGKEASVSDVPGELLGAPIGAIGHAVYKTKQFILGSANLICEEEGCVLPHVY